MKVCRRARFWKNGLARKRARFDNGGMAMGTRKQQERQEGLWIATADLPRSGGHPFYERLNELLAEAGYDTLCGGAVPEVLRSEDGAVELSSGDLLPAAAGGVFRGAGLGAGDRLASGRFAGAAAVSADRTGGGAAGSLDDLADAAADRRGNAPGRVHLGAGDDRGKGTAGGEDAGDRCDDAGSECGAAEHCAAGERGELRGVSDAAGEGIGDRDADAGGAGAAGPEAEAEGIEPGVG